MIWLASYPRSGNTLLRTILNDCFDVVTGSKYPEADTYAPHRQLIGLERGLPSRLMKTHDHPTDDAPAIVSVRDGRASVVSYWHFLGDYSEPVDLRNVISGSVGFGSWSDHVRAWNPETRPDTLRLRFEEFSVDPEVAIEALATFLNLRPLRRFDKTFDDLQMVDAKFFRSGDNAANIRELSGDNLALFTEVHGPTMRHLGYW